MAEKPGRRPATKVVLLTPERVLERAARRFLPERTNACVKCGSAFIDQEPAFIHCRYCGAIIRIANRSLAAQEEFELRSGLRVAS
jgi:DNA-directed RNA polymerase subunit RPC12/RpoP